MNILKRIVSLFTYKSIVLNLKSIIYPNHWIPFNKSNLALMTIDETIDYIDKNKVSVARFGDGEFGIMNKSKSVNFQEINNCISERLIEIIQSSDKGILICLPNQLRYISETNRRDRKFWIEYTQKNLKDIQRHIQKNKIYGNAHITRIYMNFKNKNKTKERFDKFRKIWYKQDVLIVEGEYTRSGIGSDLYKEANSIERIICPSRNAFDKYDLILNEIIKSGTNKLILIALGPTATILAYDLAQQGFWAIDIGHLDVEYMWMSNNAKKKTTLIGRYVDDVANQIDEDLNVPLMTEYKNQIIKSVL